MVASATNARPEARRCDPASSGSSRVAWRRAVMAAGSFSPPAASLCPAGEKRSAAPVCRCGRSPSRGPSALRNPAGAPCIDCWRFFRRLAHLAYFGQGTEVQPIGSDTPRATIGPAAATVRPPAAALLKNLRPAAGPRAGIVAASFRERAAPAHDRSLTHPSRLPASNSRNSAEPRLISPPAFH